MQSLTEANSLYLRLCSPWYLVYIMGISQVHKVYIGVHVVLLVVCTLAAVLDNYLDTLLQATVVPFNVC